MDEVPAGARKIGPTGDEVESAVECGDVADRAGAGARALREILGQFAVPGARRLGHRALGRHPLFNRTPTVITLVGLHLPLHSVPPTIAREWLNNG